jgi:hypothetical protein
MLIEIINCREYLRLLAGFLETPSHVSRGGKCHTTYPGRMMTAIIRKNGDFARKKKSGEALYLPAARLATSRDPAGIERFPMAVGTQDLAKFITSRTFVNNLPDKQKGSRKSSLPESFVDSASRPPGDPETLESTLTLLNPGVSISAQSVYPQAHHSYGNANCSDNFKDRNPALLPE